MPTLGSDARKIPRHFRLVVKSEDGYRGHPPRSYLEACKIAGVTPKYERPKNKKPNDSERDKIKEVRKAVRDAEIAKTIFDERRPIVGTIAQTFLHEHRKLETALLPMLASRRDVAFHPAVKFVAEGNCKLFSKISSGHHRRYHRPADRPSDWPDHSNLARSKDRSQAGGRANAVEQNEA